MMMIIRRRVIIYSYQSYVKTESTTKNMPLSENASNLASLVAEILGPIASSIEMISRQICSSK